MTGERMRAAYWRGLTDLASAARCRPEMPRPAPSRPFSLETNFSKTGEGLSEDNQSSTTSM